MIKTVAELIADLSELNPAAQVYLSRDSEGNGFYPLTDGSMSFGADVQTYDGDAAIVLWPGYPETEIDFGDDDDEL